jgi:hypothetical protein
VPDRVRGVLRGSNDAALASRQRGISLAAARAAWTRLALVVVIVDEVLFEAGHLVRAHWYGFVASISFLDPALSRIAMSTRANVAGVLRKIRPSHQPITD